MSFRHHVFVDYENVSGSEIELNVGGPVAFTIVLGRHQKSLPVALVMELQRLPPRQVTPVQSTTQGRNALDFVLSFLVGRVVERNPGVSIQIISRDKGFDALVEHLKSLGLTAERHESLASLQAVFDKANWSSQAPGATGVNGSKNVQRLPFNDPENLGIILDALELVGDSRPRKRSSLAGFIKQKLGQRTNTKHTKALIASLIEQGKVIPVGASSRLEYAEDAWRSQPTDASQPDAKLPERPEDDDDSMPF